MDSMASGRSARLPATPSINVRSFESNHNYQGSSIPNSTFSNLTPDFAVTTTQVLDNLSERERQMILAVLQRDEGIRQREATRIMLLRAELQSLRRRGAIKIEAGSLDRPTIEIQRSCSRCCSELGRIINRGAPCRSCRLRVCKACREFTRRTTDWVCVVCHKQMELQSATGEWMNEFSRGPPRRDSASDIIKKSIRRSWTISSPQNEYLPHIRNGAEYRNYSSLPPSQEISNYPSLMQHQLQSAQMQFSDDKAQDYIDDVNYQDVPQQRRILRQSTLPNPDVNNYFGNNNLLPPGSPKQQLSPQYSPYNTDNENMMDLSDQEVQQPTAPPRFTIRRQSTLPCRPNEHHASVKYSSTSPSRSFSRSPEKSDDQPRCPPFRRQSTFPSNSSEQLYPPHQQRPKLLPTSPSRLVFSKSPDGPGETTEQAVRYQMLRQSTLPNPDQHLKLLPTSPPKKQLSPQYMKRSPEFSRQNTLPNPDTMTSLSIHQHGVKFLPISPRQKQNFLFPQPQQHPRPFLSQQNFPTMTDEQGSTQSIAHRDHSKMIKVRSHSNEEYTNSRSYAPSEGRRLLPEIPTRRSPRVSPNNSLFRLVRQEHVKEDLIRTNSEQRSPIKRTFAEAKQTLAESFDDPPSGPYGETPPRYVDYPERYLEADESSYLETAYDEYEGAEKSLYPEEGKPPDGKASSRGHPVRSTESFLNDSSPEYFHPDDYIRTVKKERTRRRRSREMIEPELVMSSNDEEPILRRADTVKVPSPKPLAELLEKQKKEKLSKLPSPRRKNYKSLDLPDSALSSAPKAIPLQKRDSRSLEAVMKTASMSERLRNALDDNKCHSLDEGIFNESDERKASICDEQQDVKRKLPAEHKTTLGEAEIQSAVEAAAVIFKKVVLQRRNAKKAAEEGGDACTGPRNRKSSLMQDDISDYENCNGLKMLYPDTDEYKLVFISSADSSSKEEEFEDSSSTTSSVNTRHSISLDDCDWDYFEPGVGSRAIFRDFSVSPFDSPSVRRKHFKSSPMTSPIFYRRGHTESPFLMRQRLRESDTGTDEELLVHAESSSPTSSDGFVNQELMFMKNFTRKTWSQSSGKVSSTSECSDKGKSAAKKECTCGGTTVFVPIPVLIPPNWNPSDLLVQPEEIEDSVAKQKIRAIQQRQVDIFQLWNTAALVHQQQKGEEEKAKIQQADQEGGTTSASGVFRNTEPVPYDRAEDGGSTGPTVEQIECNPAVPIATPAQEEVVVASDARDVRGSDGSILVNRNCTPEPTDKVSLSLCDGAKQHGKVANDAISVDSCETPVVAESNLISACRERYEGSGKKQEENPVYGSEVEKKDKMSVGSVVDTLTCGYLQSENVFSSDSDSSHDSDVGQVRPIRRSYDVTGDNAHGEEEEESDNEGDGGVSDVGHSDNEERQSVSSSSAREDPSSSETEATDSDDTGTVADRRPKSKRFSRVFVVNRRDSSSDSQSSDGNTEDSSDNDTDTEKDCGIILNYVKEIPERETNRASTTESSSGSGGSESEPDGLVDEAHSDDPENPIVLNYIRCLDDDGETPQEVVLNSVKFLDDDEVHAALEANTFHGQELTDQPQGESTNSAVVCSAEKTYNVLESSSDSQDNETEEEEEEECDTRVSNESCAVSDEHTINAKSDNVSGTSGMENTQTESPVADSLEAAVQDESECCIDTSLVDNEVVDRSSNDVSNVWELPMKEEEAFPEGCSSDSLNVDDKISSNEKSREEIADKSEGRSVDDENHDGEETSLEREEMASSGAVAAAATSVEIESATNSCGGAPIHTGDREVCTHTTTEICSSDRDGSPTAAAPGEGNTVPTHDEDTCESGEGDRDGDRGGDHEVVESEQSTSTDAAHNGPAGGTKYTSLVMITQDARATTPPAVQVNIVATDTTRIVSDEESDTVIVHHTNSQDVDDVCSGDNTLAGYFMRALGADDVSPKSSKRRPIKIVNSSENTSNGSTPIEQDKCSESEENKMMMSGSGKNGVDDVTVVTGANTLSAVISLEEGLADDDSWVEEISNNDDEEFGGNTATDSDMDSGEEITLSSTIDREEELRGYNRTAIDFTLHTIVEESCEESEVEQSSMKNKYRVSASDLEKYFFYGLGDGKPSAVSLENREDSLSESSSICSEGMDSLGGPDDANVETNPAADLTASRLEKYFLTGFMGFSAEHADSDGSGSVGSDSEGRPSPEQRRKKLVRARGSGRSHSSSLDNLLAKEDCAPDQVVNDTNDSNDSSETDTCDENTLSADKPDGQSDTMKRKKQNKKRLEHADDKEESDLSDDEDRKTPQPEYLLPPNNLVQSRKQHSRDSGFVGSNDDLLKTDDSLKSSELKVELEEIEEENRCDVKETESSGSATKSTPPSAMLTRKDSFNNWSSDEETNVMMSKMRQFFKTLVAASANVQSMSQSSKVAPTTTHAELSGESPKSGTPIAKPRNRSKPPQLVYFENELTRLMKTVPGINDDQVREIVEYLSSEDTWSDSYDSSDYTSSDLEGAGKKPKKSELQEQISASCQQIINKFDSTVVDHDEEGDRGDGGLLIGETNENPGLNRETAFVYQKLVASFSKIAAGEEKPTTSTGSPPIFAKVIHHIGSRLVALMHEVSSGESHASSSPRGAAASRHHRRLQAKISATTTEDDDSTSDSAMEKPEKITFAHLPRSKSHDLLLGESRPLHHQSSSGVSDTAAEEKEASDYERFSWRGSFESALLANGDSRTKLTLLDHSSSATALAAKRRSAGDLLFNQKSLSREQLDRVRSCGSIGGGMDHEIEGSKLWGSSTSQKSARRRSSVPDAACESDNDSSDDERHFATRSTLPRSLQTTASNSTNSLPRLSTSNLPGSTSSKQHSVYHFLQNNVKSARYRAPGFNRPTAMSKKTLSAPGLQHQSLTSMYQRRDGRRKVQNVHTFDENPISPEVAPTSPVAAASKSNVTSGGPTSPAGSRGSASTDPWPSQSDEDIDRLVALHQNRNSLSSLGLRSDSMASVYSGAGEGRYGTVVVKGNIEFGMQYNYKQNALEIHIVQCKDLAAVDAKRNRSDPYVKVYLLPDKSKSGKRKTKVKKHTLNPFFDEVLKFHMSISSLESRTLWLTVWHSDMFGRNDFLGEVLINLQGKLFDNPQPQWYQLQERSEPFDEPAAYRGDIIVGLKFVPPDSGHNSTSSFRKFSKSSITARSSTKGSLHVLVKEAKNLMPVKANGTCDAFCKSYLLPEKSRSSKRKTDVIKRTVNPVWNHTIVYEDVTLQELSERAIELTIWDHDRLASNEFLGGVRFSLGTGKHYGKPVEWMDATGKELSLWQSMLNRPNFWVEGCLVLRSSIDTARNSL
ncbi:uncharacterized protein LOC129786747 isoform X3 [Lutzomyia longipalpis]|uniref:uncharacterized protein LOC129786747 isoform X3 n=1 Tax=Lutzomyia longipalpis TaxID=7200 RepID=UPI00248358E8|nr:uncharacterized protein LOC129786747 isoform X3 [Lutzomyia longipalpis]